MASRQPAQRAAYAVYLDAPELAPRVQVGNLYPADIRVDLAPSFAYSPEWLASSQRFLLDPRLDLYGGEQHSTDARGFGIFLDSAPDRWGRVLMKRREASQALRQGRAMRRLTDLDFMLGVNDLSRAGALRFRRTSDGTFVDDQALAAPPVTDLRELAAIAKQLDTPGAEAMPEYDNWLATLIAPGSSLGGARPKSSFSQTDGALWLAKFPAHDDRHDWGGWEYLTHQLAREAGVEVPDAELLALGGRHRTFCVKRFDRGVDGDPPARRMFASAMAVLEREDGQAGASYLDLVEVLETQGGNGLTKDLQQLFRRAVFNLLVGNRDDHLRNHGFIRLPSGWRLSPAFDINPSRDKRQHALTWDGKSAEPDLAKLKQTAPFYRLARPIAAQAVIDEVQSVVATWRDKARALQLPSDEVQVMATGFAI